MIFILKVRNTNNKIIKKVNKIKKKLINYNRVKESAIFKKNIYRKKINWRLDKMKLRLMIKIQQNQIKKIKLLDKERKKNKL